MDRVMWVIVAALLVTPVSAQDDPLGQFGVFGGGGGALDDGPLGGLFGDDFGGLRVPTPDSEPADPLTRLRDILAKAGVPLNRVQETGLNALLEAEIPVMTAALRERILEIMGPAAVFIGGGSGRDGQAEPGVGQPQAGGGQPQGQAPGEGRVIVGERPPGERVIVAPSGERITVTGRGGQPQGQTTGGGRGFVARGGLSNAVFDTLADPDGPVMAEVRRMNDELLTKVTATLRPDQQAVIEQWRRDQIRAHGGLDALKLALDEAGAPLTAEQIPQVQAFFSEENQARLRMTREQGQPPDEATLSALRRDTLTKVVRLLDAGQQRALREFVTQSQP